MAALSGRLVLAASDAGVDNVSGVGDDADAAATKTLGLTDATTPQAKAAVAFYRAHYQPSPKERYQDGMFSIRETFAMLL